MKRLFLCFCFIALKDCATAQTVNAIQQITVQGLRASSGQGSFRAAKYAADGSLFLLYDQGDGIRILKSDTAGNAILAQSLVGTTGDSGVAMALDAAGNVYVTGTTMSTALSGTSGVPFTSRADTSINSFLAKYDPNLNLVFMTFLGSGRTAAASVTATADAVFVTGVTFSAALAVTPGGIQQTPRLDSSENGFVESFTADGSTLRYATYLTGANGNTVPTAIVADSSDNAYIAGSTSATGFPTIGALQPAILGSNSGFLSKLTSAGDGFVYSTFIAGTGITSMALDTASDSLLLTGNVSLGQFPVDTVLMPLTSATYQTLLRIPFDGQSVTSSVLLVPGTASYVSAGSNGDAWITGPLTTPLFPRTVPPNYSSGDSFLLHLQSNNTFDQTLRLGGRAINNPGYASLTSTTAAPAINGTSVTVPGTVQATVAASLISTQRFDLPLVQTPNAGLLPNNIRDALPPAASCNNQCNGTAAFLATVSTASSAPSLSLSIDDVPNITLRNLGSATATGLAVTANGFSVTTNCGALLDPSTQCNISLMGSGPGSITVSSTNATPVTTAIGTNSLAADSLVLDTTELDFGIATTGSPASRTLVVTNLSSNTQTFISALNGAVGSTATWVETASDCASGNATDYHVIAANSSCNITLQLTTSTTALNDGPVQASWKIGTHDIPLTGFVQVNALNISAIEVDFGTHFAINGVPSGINLPRYLYLSNNSTTSIQHATAALPASAAFRLEDACPSVLEPHSICRIKLTYSPTNSPSQDSLNLSLDNGVNVLLTGTTIPPASVTGSSTNPNLSVSTMSVNFSSPIVVTGTSNMNQSVLVRNTGVSAFALSVTIAGDFQLTNGCPTLLAAGTSCTLQIGFAPSQPGIQLGLLSVAAGTGLAPTYIALSGTAAPILPTNNGILDLGETRIGEPTVAWYKIQQPLASLTVSSNSSAFQVALVENTGSVPAQLPPIDFSARVISACSNCWIGVQLLTETVGLQSGTLTVSTTPNGNPYTLTLAGTSVPVQGALLTPTVQDFGTVNVNSTSAPIVFTLTNLIAGSSPITIQSVTANGDFKVVVNGTGGASCVGILMTTSSCFVQVMYSPSSPGEGTGTLDIVTSAGTLHAGLTGYGATDPGISISPIELDFKNTPGPSATQQSVTLSNTSGYTLTIGSMVTSDPSFNLVSDCTALAPGSNCSVSVSFMPQAATVKALLSIPVTVTINGQTNTSTYNVSLNGDYTSVNAGLQIIPAEVDFGAFATGTSGESRQFTLNNLSAKQLNVTLHMPRQFPLAAASACTTLVPGGSCTFSVNFLPVLNGPITGTVVAMGDSTDGSSNFETLTYMLGYGTGIGDLEIDGLPIPYSPLNFGQLTSGQSSSRSLTITNGGGSPLAVHRISSAPPFLTTNTCGTSLVSGASCSVTINYAPVYQVGSGASSMAARTDTESLVIESDAASSPDIVSLTGLVAPFVTVSPMDPIELSAFDLSQSSLTFANTQLGSTSAPQTINMTNTGSTTLHIASVVAPSDFTANTNCTTLLVGASCQITAELAPTTISASTTRSGALQILSDASESLEFVSLTGLSSAAPLAFNPTTLNFGSINLGSTATLSLNITNTTALPITFLGYAAGGDYSVAMGSCPAIGTTLPAGASCSFNISFAPSSTGIRNGSLTVSTDATSLPLNVALAGTGVQLVAPPPSFTLTVNGGSVTTLTVPSGSPAVYNLMLTPINGFVGPVALTCTPVVAAAYASCSLLSSTLMLNGSALSSTATINTITTAAIRIGTVAAAVLLGGVLLFWRRRRHWLSAAMMTFVLLGCGSTSRSSNPSKILKTPAGTYQYQVTASSTSGTVVSSTVTLNLIVQ